MPNAQRPPRAVSAVRGAMTVCPGGPLISFESELERRLLTLLRCDPRVLAVLAQPLTLGFLDHASGKRRRYTPDYLVSVRADSGQPAYEVLIEVKARRDLFRGRRRQRAPFAAAQRWADQEAGRQFMVVTDVHMGLGAWLRNAEVLSAHLDRRYEERFLGQCLGLFGPDLELQLDELVARARQQNLNCDAVLSAIYHLLGQRRLNVELAFPIGWSSWIRLNEASRP